MAINFPNSPTLGQLYTFSGTTWEWTPQQYWKVYSAQTGYITSVLNSGIGFSVINNLSSNALTLKTFSGESVTITDTGTQLNFSVDNYNAGVIFNYSGWSNNGNGTMNLPTVQVALYNNTNFLDDVRVYTVASGVTGSGGISGLTDNDTNYIYIEYNNGSPRWVVSTDNSAINGSTVVRFQTVYRIGNFIHNLEWGNEGAGLPNKIANRIDAVDRFARESGLSLGLSGSTGVVTLSSGVAWNGTLRQSLDPVNSQTDIFFQNFHSGGTWVISTTADTLNNLYYDNGTDRVAAGVGTYLVNWYYRGQEINDHLYEVWGNSAYTSVSEAQLSTQPDLPELITSHAFLLGRIIVQKNALTGFVETAFVTPFQSTTVQNHNDLTGLQGGSAGEYYHLNANQYNNIALTNANNNFSTSQTINGNLIVTGDTIIQSGLTANTINTTQLGSSGDCVDDIYVFNIHSCSPLNINPLDEGNVYFGSTSGVTINLSGTPKVSINTNFLDAKLNILNSFTTIGSELLSNPSISANTTGWFLSNCTTWSPGLFTYFYSGCNECEIVWTNVNLTSGKYYLVSFEITECNNPVYINFDFNNPPGTFDANKQFGTGKHKFLFKSDYTGTDTIYFYSFECDGTIKIGNFSFIEVQSPDYIIDGQYFEGSNLFKLGGYGENISLGEESATSTSGNTNVISIGSNAGSGVKDKKFNTFIGNSAGLNSDIDTSIVIGTLAGGFSKQKESIIIGQLAGYLSSGNTGGGGGKNIFIGDNSGRYSNTNNSSLTLIGRDSGFGMYNSFANVGIGFGVGFYASGVSTNMIGTYVGRSSQTSYSTLIGYQAGESFTGGNNNIIIGTNVTLPNNVSNSINLGNVLYGINTYSVTTGGPSNTPTIQGKIGIGVVTPLNRLHVEDTSNPVRFVGLQSGTTDTRVLTSDSNGVIRYRNFSDFSGGTSNFSGDYLPLSGGTVTGGTIFQSGLTANTISATTISGGTFYGNGSNLTGIQNIYNSDGVLTGNRTLSGASNNLTFSDFNIFKTTSGGTDVGLSIDFASEKTILNNYRVGLLLNDNDLTLGDFDGNTSSTYIVIEPTYPKIFAANQGSPIGLLLDYDKSRFELGDFNNISGGTKIIVDDASQEIKLTNISASTDSNVLTIDNSGVVHKFPISGLTGNTGVSGNFLPLSGGTVTGNTIFQSGLTATTISATTYLNLPIKYYKEPTADPTNSPIVSGIDSIAIGDGAQALSNNMLSFGTDAGSAASTTQFSNFIGYQAGFAANNSCQSTFIGYQAGYGSTNSTGGTFIGECSGYQALNTKDNVFIGCYVGVGANGSCFTNVIGARSGSDAQNSCANNFIGYAAGASACNVRESTFIGTFAGVSANLANDSVFIGTQAGLDADDSCFSNFIGDTAGRCAFNSKCSNFIGYQAGFDTSNSCDSNYFGECAGWKATGSCRSNFIGFRAGACFAGNNVGNNNIIIGTNISLPNATSNGLNIGGVLFGINTYSPISGSPSVTPTVQGKIGIGVVTPLNRLHVEDTSDPLRLVGLQSNSTDLRILTSDSNGVVRFRNFTDFRFTGGTVSGDTIFQSGLTANTISATTYLNLPIKYYAEPLIPPTVSPIATGTTSIAIGDGAQALSNQMFVYGKDAGQNATNVENSIFLGKDAGNRANGSSTSTFIGLNAGSGATDALTSLFVGTSAGIGASNLNNSIFIGSSAGNQSILTSNSVFLGALAGNIASGTSDSNFIGFGAGDGATNSSNSNFIGYKSGRLTTGSTHSNLIGWRAGQSWLGNTIGSNNIIIGTNISLPNSVSNSLNIGGILYGINTNPIPPSEDNNPIIVPTSQGKIGIGVVAPTNKLHIVDSSDPLKVEGVATLNSDTEVLTIDTNGVVHKRTYDYITGFTYSNSSNTFTIRTTSGNSLSASINQMTGLTVNGDLRVTGNYFVTGDTIVSGNTVFTGTTTFNSVPNAIGDFLTRPSSGVMSRRTADQVRDDISYYGLTFAITNGYY